MNRNQLPAIPVVTSATGHLIGNVIPGLEHVRDPDWPAHASAASKAAFRRRSCW